MEFSERDRIHSGGLQNPQKNLNVFVNAFFQSTAKKQITNHHHLRIAIHVSKYILHCTLNELVLGKPKYICLMLLSGVDDQTLVQ